MPDVVIVLIVVLIIVLIWRGPKTLPKLGEAFGRGVREARAEATKVVDKDAPPTGGPPAAGGAAASGGTAASGDSTPDGPA